MGEWGESVRRECLLAQSVSEWGEWGSVGYALAKSVRRKRVWGEKCEHVPGVGARWGREGGEEGAETVHTLVSENEARARWERLQSFFTTFHAYRVASGVPSREWGTHSTDLKLSAREWGPPYSGKLKLWPLSLSKHAGSRQQHTPCVPLALK